LLIGACGFALILAGCSSVGGSDWSEYLQLARGEFGSASNVTLQQAAAVPFASMGVRIGDGAEGMVVLATNASGDKLWTSIAKVAIYTRRGRIVRTSGLPRNVNGTSMQPQDPLDQFARGETATQDSTKLIDIADLGAVSAPLICETASRGNDPIVVLGKTIATQRIEEHCRATTLNWSFTDTYWMAQDGLVWRSIQHIHPDGDPIEMEILRPPTDSQ
jgi:hypothetical protein